MSKNSGGSDSSGCIALVVIAVIGFFFFLSTADGNKKAVTPSAQRKATATATNAVESCDYYCEQARLDDYLETQRQSYEADYEEFLASEATDTAMMDSLMDSSYEDFKADYEDFKASYEEYLADKGSDDEHVLSPTTQNTYANRDSNLRAGPGTEYNIVGLARKGQAVTVVGCAKSCSWYLLSDNKWIAAHLVDGAVGSYPTVLPPPAPTSLSAPTIAPTPIPTFTAAPTALPQPTAAPPTATPVPTVAPQACVIKGNISYNTGEKIYHVPGQAYYEQTVINEAYGERWFCTEQEAQAAGWRKAKQ